ncbi:MAG: preprotein translocase subunit SecG [Eubacteriaceae bacterium]|jgi:protein translocase SecG subunit
MEILNNIILGLLIVVSIVMTVAIVLLPPKAEGMGSAIGGQDSTLFGSKKSHGFTAVLEKTVKWSAAIFMISAFVYNVILKFI